MRSLVVLLLALASLAVAARAEAERAAEARPAGKPLPIDVALRMRTFLPECPIDLSPDGQRVAYTLRSEAARQPMGEERYHWFGPDGVSTFAGAGCDVWVTETATGKSQNVTRSVGSSWAPVWSPDGQRLAFYSSRSGVAGMWVWERRSGELRRLSQAVVRPLFTSEVPLWTPDGKYLLCKVLPTGVTLETAARRWTAEALRKLATGSAKEASVVVYRSVPGAEKDDQEAKAHRESFEVTHRSRADLALIHVATGQVRRLATDVFPYGYSVSPDGRHVAFTSNAAAHSSPAEDVHDLEFITLASGKRWRAASLPRTWWGRPVAWSPDGRRFAALSFGERETACHFFQPGSEPRRWQVAVPQPTRDVFQRPAWGATSERLYFMAGEGVWEVDSEGGFRQVSRLVGSRFLSILTAADRSLWSRDGASLLLRVRVDESREEAVYRIDLASGEVKKLVQTQAQVAPEAAFDASGRSAVFLRESAREPADLWLVGADWSGARRLTHANPELDRYALGTVRRITWTGTAGQALQGALLLPPDWKPGTPCPMVVRVYGGARLSQNINQYGLSGTGVDDAQLLATRGCAVLLADAPLRPGRPAEDLAGTVLPGIDRAVELGYADPKRIGLIGHSYGGYSVLVLLTRDTRFRAAVVTGGFASMMSAYASMREDGSAMPEFWEAKLGGTPWERQNAYVENSPIFRMDAVQTPLLLLHGEKDASASARLPEEVFVSLRRLGRPVEYVKYLGEGHAPSRWSAAHQRDCTERLLRWFDLNLR